MNFYKHPEVTDVTHIILICISVYNVLLYSRPWICYWILHSIALLGQSVGAELEDRTVNFLSLCQV